MKRWIVGLSALALLLSAAVSAKADVMGTLYYTTFSGGADVNKVTYTYVTGTSFTFSGNANIAHTPGADGLVFTSDGYLAVGGQGTAVYKVNPTTGAFTTVGTGGPTAYEMMVAPNGTIYSSGSEGGTPTPSSYTSTLSGPGTPHTVTGSDPGVTHIAWSDATHAFYTANLTNDAGGGNFGIINTTTFVTTRLITGLAAAHGMTFDPFSGDLILFGGDSISQIDPTTGLVVSTLVLSGQTFDQGAVDGLGHIFVASNNTGDLAFIDYSGTGLVGSASNFVRTPFLAGSLDDVAPLSGAGSNSAPEPASLTLLGIGVAGVVGYAWRRRKNARA
jgi:hypothetical protein